MSSTGAGYDYAPTIYSPDGRIFQVEYAQKAIDSGGTSIGVKCKDGVVLANEKLLFSKMLVDSSNRAHFGLDLHCGMVTSGILPDGRQLALRARSVAKQFKGAYALPIIPQQLADQMGQFITRIHVITSSGPSAQASFSPGTTRPTKRPNSMA